MATNRLRNIFQLIISNHITFLQCIDLVNVRQRLKITSKIFHNILGSKERPQAVAPLPAVYRVHEAGDSSHQSAQLCLGDGSFIPLLVEPTQAPRGKDMVVMSVLAS
jgi:hypothetical protein